MYKLTDDKEFLSTLFEAIPAVTLVVNEDSGITAINSATKDVFNVTENEVSLMKSKGFLPCMNAIGVSKTCGRTDICNKCVIRHTARQAIKENCTKRAKGKIIILNGELKELYILVSASPLEYKGEKLAVVILENISIIDKLQGLLSICSHCKSIYNEQGCWERLERYIENHSEVEFTHDICPQCMQQLYPSIKISS
jgi:PAS domain-containing protein